MKVPLHLSLVIRNHHVKSEPEKHKLLFKNAIEISSGFNTKSSDTIDKTDNKMCIHDSLTKHQ